LTASYKPQQLSPKFPGTVRQLLEQRVPQALCDSLYVSDVLKALDTEWLMGLKVCVRIEERVEGEGRDRRGAKRGERERNKVINKYARCLNYREESCRR
jgi:hypothetical protein